MANCYSAWLPLLLLLIGQTTAGPQPRAAQPNACQEHNALSDKLDAVEQRVEDTVQKLEAELAILLGAIEAPEWRPLLATGKPVIDILDENSPGPLA